MNIYLQWTKPPCKDGFRFPHQKCKTQKKYVYYFYKDNEFGWKVAISRFPLHACPCNNLQYIAIISEMLWINTLLMNTYTGSLSYQGVVLTCTMCSFAFILIHTRYKQFISTLGSSAYIITFSYKDDTMLLNDKKKLWKEKQEI